ncbi:hypothetical protein Ancab_028209 [Ancistrocladus abbreviatus]
MGKVEEKKRKKKKGRPSLLDLQKRSLKQQEVQLQKQQQNQLHKSNRFQNPNPNSTPTPLRRSTRRNPHPDLSPAPSDAGEDEDDHLSGIRREKKLKLVLNLPNSSLNSGSVNSGSDSNAEDDNTATNNHKKRKVDAISDGSGHEKDDQDQNHDTAKNPAKNNIHQDAVKLDNGPSTPLPDKKLLLFILDRLQKKDTYGVFAEPVDPEELPDYHEVIEHPMDFSTVRKKLTIGSYANLEQFEKDVFLICSNAMQYNAPDTIYFRQARSIQELAQKNFENLRQDSDDNEPEPKIAKRGRPPTKNLKKPVGRPSLERAALEVSGATLATGGENANRSSYDPRKAVPLEKYGSTDSFGRSFHGSRQGEVYISWSAERCDRTDEFIGSSLKGTPVKHGKKQIVLDESRRSTYMQSYASAGRREPSALAIFSGERQLLIPVGLHTEYGYASSLARFAAKLGPAAWKVASKKIDRCLPPGVKFGPGWVGENEAAAQRPLVQPSPIPLSQPLPPKHFSVPGNSSCAAAVDAVEPSGNKPSENSETNGLVKKHLPSRQLSSDDQSSKPPSPPVASTAATVASSPIVASSSPGPSSGIAEAARGFSSQNALKVLNNSVGAARPRFPLQIHQNSLVQHCMNGVNGTFGFNVPAQLGKLMGVSRPTGINLQPHPAQDATSRTESSNISQPTAKNSSNSENTNLETSTATKPSDCLPNFGHSQPSWQGLSPKEKSDSVPPDLNVRFQSPGSPGSGRADSMQPDLALQL